MVESKSENGLLFALQCGWLMYNYDKEINWGFVYKFVSLTER